MAQTVKLKRSAVAAKVPLTTDLALGELAVNTNDGALYTLINDGTNKIVQLGGQSVTATVTAGTNAQGQGALTSNVNVVTTTAANPSGVTLPTALLGRKIIVHNRGTNPINVYPASGAQIDAAGTNVSLQVPVNGRVEFNATSTTQWYSSFPSTLISPTITSAALSGALTVGGSTGTSGQALVSTGASTPAWTTLTLENLPDAWVKRAVKAATTADLAAASSTATTLTGTLVVFPAQDGISFAVGDRLLVKNQTTAAQNGIYTLTTAGVAGTTAWVLTRATDADTALELAGATVAVDQGTTQGGFTYDCDFKSTDTIGTTACNFARVLDTAAISGDATVSASGALTIANNAVTFAKIQNSAAAGMSVVGRSANSAGVFAEISAGTDGHVLRRSGTAIGFGEIATAGIANDAVTFAKIQNSAAAGLSVIGRSANSAGDFAEIAAGTDGHVLYRASSTSLTFGQLPTASIANSAITYAKIQNVSSSNRLLGRSTAGAGVVEEITCTATGFNLISLNSQPGGVIYGGTGSTVAFTAAGSSGQFLKSNAAAAPTWATLEMTDIPGAVYKKSVKAATTADLGTVTYANGTAGVGATITGPTGASAVVFPNQDGVPIILNDRILVKNQTTAAQNGIYTLTTVGVAGTTAWVLTRATDADTNVEIGAAVVAVDQGTTNGGELWTTNFKSTDTIGTTAMTWNEVIYNNFSNPTFSGTLTTGSTITAGDTPVSIYPGNTSTNIAIGSGLTTGTFTAGGTGSTGAVFLFPATGGQSITLGGATTGTITIGSTSASAVQLPTGKTKIGQTTLVQGGPVSITLPTNIGTLVGTGDTGSVTNAMLAGSIALTKLTSDTTTALGVGTLELGNASDTTLSRSAAGVLAVEGAVVPTISSTNDLTNKTYNGLTITTPGADTFTLTRGSSTLVRSGAHACTLTTTASTSVTLPTTGTLATLAGAESLSSKTYIVPFTQGGGTALTIAAEATNQALFPAAGDTITLAAGVYEVNMILLVTRGAVSTTSAALRINLLGAGTAAGTFTGVSVSTLADGGASNIFHFGGVNINANNTITIASTTAAGSYRAQITGIIKITIAGTIIPAYGLTANLASAGSTTGCNTSNYMRLLPISTTGTTTAQGGWA